MSCVNFMGEPLYTYDSGLLYCGDVVEQLSHMDDGSVDCVVTSPPYFGLRDYGTALWKGGDKNCSHKVGRSTRGGVTKIQNGNQGSFGDESIKTGESCPHCGAIRVDKQIGMESTPQAFVESMVEVFREVHRVLKDDGTLWLNLGDSYNGSGGAGGDYNKGGLREGQPRYKGRNVSSLKRKELMGIPWRVAFALQDDGWYLRQDIIWHKPNPMPESVRDRCTKAHEYIFMFTKNPKYFFDNIAIKEPAKQNRWGGKKPINVNNSKDKDNQFNGLTRERDMMPPMRNKRSVWFLPTRSYKGAHFATFPPALIEPCILAGTSEHGHCSDCGKRWVRDIKRSGGPNTEERIAEVMNKTGLSRKAASAYSVSGAEWKKHKAQNPDVMLGWKPSCKCGADVETDVVLDPFMGSGTTAVVATNNNRRFVGIDLNPDYLKLADERIRKETDLE